MFTFLEERSRRLLATLTAVALLAGLSVGAVIAPAQAADAPVANPQITVTPNADVDPAVATELTVSGTGFVGAGARFGTYVSIGETAVWNGGVAYPATGWLTTEWVSAGSVVDGAFTVVLRVPAGSFDASKTYQVATTAAHGLSQTDRTLDAFAPVAIATPAPAWTPQIEVFAADGVTPLADTPVTVGDTIVVKGAGFDPAANVGGRGMPIPATLPQGNYVVFGNFAENWRPSTGAASATRKVGPQAWALTEDTINQVPDMFQPAVRAQWTELSAEGTFTTTLTLTDLAALDGGTYGVYTYAGGGIKNADQELAVPVTFSNEVVVPATETTTAISAAPADVTAGGTAALIATVTPADAAGTVEFLSGDAVVGSAPLTQGVATVTTGALALGAHSFTARFVPADAALFAASTTTSGVTVTASAAPVQPEPEVPLPAADGQLVWGVKESFRNYIVHGPAAGSIEATTTTGGLFAFGQAASDFNGSTGSIDYSGWVRFTGHHGALDLKLSNPRVTITGPATAILVVDVVGTGLTGGSVNSAGVEFATLTLGAPTTADGATTWTNAAAALTAAGSAAFSDFYPAGTALDPVSFTVGADITPELPETGNPTAPTDPTDPTVPTVPPLAPGIHANATVNVATALPGGEVTVTGYGFGSLTAGIELAVYSERQVLLTGLVADANGTVKATVNLPKDLPAGVHTLSFEAPNGVKSQVAITVEVPAAPAKQCVANSVSGATLTWGVKSAFRSYVTGPIAKGAITMNGVTDSGTAFGWTGGTGAFNSEANQGRVSFPGSVNFSGHAGVLDLTISNVRVQVTSASTGTLIGDVSSTDMAGAKSSQTGVAIATLDLAGKKSTSGSTVTWTDAAASLTAAGAKAFAGSYVAGEALDPVTFSFPLGATVECDASTGILPTTGPDGVADAALLALAAMTFGLGMVMVTRRRRNLVRIG